MICTVDRFPKISCLLVTAGGRFEYFKKSVQCYFNQTYPNKELVVVNEGPKEYQQQIREYLSGRDDVNLIFLDGYYTLGALRNISISLCEGEIFVQWDDDDFNMPERLSTQYRFLARQPKARICYLSEQLHYYFDSKYLFWESWAKFHSGGRKKYGLIPGTIMAWKEAFKVRYPSAGEFSCAGEDSIAAYRLCDHEENIELLSGFGHMQIYTYHGHNVWDVQHHMKLSQERSMDCSHMNRYRGAICATIDQIGFDGPVKVMGREGLAFIH